MWFVVLQILSVEMEMSHFMVNSSPKKSGVSSVLIRNYYSIFACELWKAPLVAGGGATSLKEVGESQHGENTANKL